MHIKIIYFYLAISRAAKMGYTEVQEQMAAGCFNPNVPSNEAKAQWRTNRVFNLSATCLKLIFMECTETTKTGFYNRHNPVPKSGFIYRSSFFSGHPYRHCEIGLVYNVTKC